MLEATITPSRHSYVKDKLQEGLNRFITHESFGGILLAFCVIAAILVANSSYADLYFEFFLNYGQDSFSFYKDDLTSFDVRLFLYLSTAALWPFAAVFRPQPIAILPV